MFRFSDTIECGIQCENATPRKVTIGTYGKITVEQAREEANKVLAKANWAKMSLPSARVSELK